MTTGYRAALAETELLKSGSSQVRSLDVRTRQRSVCGELHRPSRLIVHNFPFFWRCASRCFRSVMYWCFGVYSHANGRALDMRFRRVGVIHYGPSDSVR